MIKVKQKLKVDKKNQLQWKKNNKKQNKINLKGGGDTKWKKIIMFRILGKFQKGKKSLQLLYKIRWSTYISGDIFERVKFKS